MKVYSNDSTTDIFEVVFRNLLEELICRTQNTICSFSKKKKRKAKQKQFFFHIGKLKINSSCDILLWTKHNSEKLSLQQLKGLIGITVTYYIGQEDFAIAEIDLAEIIFLKSHSLFFIHGSKSRPISKVQLSGVVGFSTTLTNMPKQLFTYVKKSL